MHYGNIIDGEYRFSVDKKWKTVRLEHIKTDKDRLVARIVSNTLRRSVPNKEKMEQFGRLGEIYLSEGIEPGKIAHKIAEETGMSYQWVLKFYQTGSRIICNLRGRSRLHGVEPEKANYWTRRRRC